MLFCSHKRIYDQSKIHNAMSRLRELTVDKIIHKLYTFIKGVFLNYLIKEIDRHLLFPKYIERRSYFMLIILCL